MLSRWKKTPLLKNFFYVNHRSNHPHNFPKHVKRVNGLICYAHVLTQRTDPQLLAQFYYADEELNQVATELDSLDGRKDPQRCTLLVNQFRSCQVSVGRKCSTQNNPPPTSFT